MKTQIVTVMTIVALTVAWPAVTRLVEADVAPPSRTTSILCTDATRQRLADLYAGSAKAGGIHKQWVSDIRAGRLTAEEIRVGGDEAYQAEWADFYDRSERLALDLGQDSLGTWCQVAGVSK